MGTNPSKESEGEKKSEDSRKESKEVGKGISSNREPRSISPVCLVEIRR